MPYLIEISINDNPPVIAGFDSGLFAVSSIITAKSHPVTGRSVQIDVGGMKRDGNEHFKWIEESLKIGDEIRIKIVRDKTIDDPIEIKKFQS